METEILFIVSIVVLAVEAFREVPRRINLTAAGLCLFAVAIYLA